MVNYPTYDEKFSIVEVVKNQRDIIYREKKQLSTQTINHVIYVNQVQVVTNSTLRMDSFPAAIFMYLKSSQNNSVDFFSGPFVPFDNSGKDKYFSE